MEETTKTAQTAQSFEGVKEPQHNSGPMTVIELNKISEARRNVAKAKKALLDEYKELDAKIEENRKRRKEYNDLFKELGSFKKKEILTSEERKKLYDALG